jgi:hypothetical protein
VSDFYELAQRLGAAGHDVTLYLVQNGVLAARRDADDEGLRQTTRGRVQVLADDFSLRERAIDASMLAPGIAAGGVDAVVGLLAAGAKSLWN